MAYFTCWENYLDIIEFNRLQFSYWYTSVDREDSLIIRHDSDVSRAAVVHQARLVVTALNFKVIQYKKIPN